MTGAREPGGRTRLRSLPVPSVLEWLCLPLGMVLTLRYAWVMDDAFIYFRYVDNLLFLDGGLTYNRGEFVEGFSSAFWLKVLALCRLSTLNFWVLTKVLGLVLFPLFWAGLVLANRWLSPRGGTAVNLPLVLLAPNYAVLCYFTSGLETPAVQLSAVVYALFLLRPGARWLQVLMGLTPMVRHELVLPFLICLAWCLWRTRRVPWWMIGTCALYVGAWGLVRIWYYADLFPNTFYLKDETNWRQGLVFLHDTLGTYHLYWIVPALVLALALLRVRGRTAEDLRLGPRLVMAACALSVALYVVRIGGDPRHYRYLAFPYCLGLVLFGGVAEAHLAPLARVPRLVLGNAAGLALGVLTFAAYPPQIDEHPCFELYTRNHQVDLINDAAHHRVQFKRLKGFSPLSVGEMPALSDYEAFLAARHPHHYDGWLAASWCADHYDAFDERAIHTLGLTDGFLSRTAMETQRAAHKPGLKFLAEDIQRIQEADPGGIGRGMFRRALGRPDPPAWIEPNLDVIEAIERKVYNRHDLLENVVLAFTFPGPIVPPEAPEGAASDGASDGIGGPEEAGGADG